MRGTALLSLLAVLAGCGGSPAPLPTDQISVFFPVGGVADTIDVETVNRLAVRDAVRIAADGRTTAANSVVAHPAPTGGATVALPSDPYSRGALTAAGNLPLPAAVGGGVQSESRLLAIISQATISLPDPAAYRRDWRKYRIRLDFGNPPDVKTREIAAPQPPPLSSLP